MQTDDTPNPSYTTPWLRVLPLGGNMILGQGETAAAVGWAETESLYPIDPPVSPREPGRIAYARLLLAQSRLRDAEAVLAELEDSAEQGECYGQSINIRVLQALTQDALGHACQAVACLEHALRPAGPEAHSGAFLDQDKAVLGDARDLPSSSEREAQIPSADRGRQGPVEPLTARETEVLQLLADGLSNREIAEQLVVTPGTAKWHVQNIRGKLQARNRTHAVAQARRIGLLP